MAKKEITYKFGANTAEVDKKLAQMSSKMKDLGKSMQNFGKSMSLYVTAPIMALGAGMAHAAMELEASDAKFQTVFKGMTNEASAFIKEFRKLTPATTAEARNMASGIQDLLVPMGFMREEATKITGELMHVTGALTNFNSGTHTAEDVVRAVQSAVTGMYRPLKSLGVQLDETTIKQKAVEYGLAGVGEELSKQVKVQVLLKEIYAQSGDALSAYTKENLDAKTSMGLLRADLSELGVQFGNILLPIINKMIDRIRGWIEVFSKLEPQTKKIIMVVGGLAAAIGPLMIVLGVLISTVIPALIAGGTFIATAWAPITLIVLGVAAAFAIFTKEVKASQKEVDKLLKAGTVDDLKKQADEINDLIVRLRQERNKPKRERTPIESEPGVAYAMDNESLDLAISQQLQLAANIEEAIKQRQKADLEAKKTAEEVSRLQKEYNKELDISVDAREEELGVLGQLEQRLVELNEQKLTAISPEELREIYSEIKNVNDAIDDLYMSMRDPSSLTAISTIGASLTNAFSIDNEKIKANLRALVNNFNEANQQIKTVVIDLGSYITGTIVEAFDMLGTAIGAALTGKKFGMDNFLQMMGDWAKRLGSIMVAAGLSVFTFQTQLLTNPLAVAGLGAALIAAGAAVKAAASDNPATGVSASYGGGGSGGDVYGYRNFGDGFNVKVTGEIVADGSQLKVIMNNEDKRLNF